MIQYSTSMMHSYSIFAAAGGENMAMDSPETVQADLVAPKGRVDAVVKCVLHDEAHLAQLLDRRIAKVAD